MLWLSCKDDRALQIVEMDPSKHILELADGPDIGLERYFLGSYASLCVCLCACERDGWSIAVASSKDHSGKPAGGGEGFPHM